MTEFDQLIMESVKKTDVSDAQLGKSCRQTLKNYQCLELVDEGGGGGAPLRMIAWDQA